MSIRKPARGRHHNESAGTLSVSIRLAQDEFERIQKVAADQERTVSNLCRRLILRALRAEETEPTG